MVTVDEEHQYFWNISATARRAMSSSSGPMTSGLMAAGRAYFAAMTFLKDDTTPAHLREQYKTLAAETIDWIGTHDKPLRGLLEWIANTP